MDVDRLDRSRVHVDVPDLESQIVSRQNVSSIVTEADIRYRRDDLRKERSCRWVFLFLKLCTMPVSKELDAELRLIWERQGIEELDSDTGEQGPDRPFEPWEVFFE